MKNLLLFFGSAFFASTIYCQVGIGTTNPSTASMLEVSSTSDGGATYGGFLPPRVPNITARDAITTTVDDLGLQVYVEDIGCFQIFNGFGWESIHCINNLGFTNLYQNFDLNTSWGYTSNVSFFDNGTSGFYGITNNSRVGFNVINTLTNNFLGVHDLDDEGNNGTNGFATITFNTINVSLAASGTTLSFDYHFFEFDNGDDAYYTLTIDGIPQPEAILIQGVSNLSISGSVTKSIPPGTLTVSLKIRIKQNGQDDFAGFDNFAIVAN